MSLSEPVKSYNLLDRILHWLALQPEVVRHLSFEIEHIYAMPGFLHRKSNHNHPDSASGAVFICGLARSGTTMLLQLLDQLESFRSLNYRDMPFVLAPNLWKLISSSSRRESVMSERAHGDGVFVGFDSPEAFEEVFWRTFSSSAEYNNGCYGSDSISAATFSKFKDYQTLVANPRTGITVPNGSPRRYLSKNNNNLVRLRDLAADPSATILLAYRDPVATARSSYRMHKRFSADAPSDFSQAYMNWLGHHEFGHGHRPFCFAVKHMNPALTPEDPNYWLDYWNAVYQHVLDQSDLTLTLISHDAMRQSPKEVLDAIFSMLNTHADTKRMAAQVRPSARDHSPPLEFDTKLLATAKETHNRLICNKANVWPDRH